MATLPPLPPGYRLEPAPRRRDPWEVLQAEGFVPTNGFRTRADIERIRRQGYSPAENSLHLRGDGVDLRHPRLSMRAAERRVRQLAREHGWDEAEILNEGHHVHFALPGWGAAPGTPGTPNSGLPELPEGFELQQRGSLQKGNFQPMAAAPQSALAQVPSGPQMSQQEAALAVQSLLPTATPNALLPISTFEAGTPAAPPPQTPAPAGLLRAEPGQLPTSQPAGTTRINSSVDPARLRQLEAAFDNLASRSELIRLAERLGLGGEPNWQRDLDAAIRWRASNRGALRSVRTFAPSASRVVAPEAPAQAIDHGQLTAHTPDLAERLGNAVGDLTAPLLGRYGGERFGNQVEGLSDWTSVGDVDAYREYGEAENRAGREGRYLDQFGNMVGQDVAAASLIPIVGAAKRSARAVREGAASLVDRVLGRADAPGDLTTHRSPLSPNGMVYGREAGDEIASSVPDNNVARRVVDRIDVSQLPPLPRGFSLVDEPELGRSRPMGERVSAEEIAAIARGVDPADVRPIPANRPESADELPTSIAPIEAPAAPGRAPRRPLGFTQHLRASMRAQSEQAGVPVRIDAEDAIDKGVPADLIYHNPTVADRSKLRLRNPGLFGTRYGRMSGTQQMLRSLDMDEVDPVQWGFDNKAGGRLDPEDIGDLIRRDLEGDTSALERGGAHDAWVAHGARRDELDEFRGRFPDGPPVEQRGEPAIAPEPPVTAYEDLPRVGGRVGNINLANVETRGDIRRLLQNVETRFGGFDAARRGRIAQAETQALADEMGLTVEDLLRRRPGQALNAEHALAARQLLAKSSDEVLQMSQRIGPEASEEARAAFARALVRHAAIHEQVSGATSEAGRALAQFKMAARSRRVSGRIHEAIVQGMGGQVKLEDIAKGILDLQNRGVGPGDVTRFAVAATRPQLRDKLIELWYNSLLSGPQTHVVNMLSNTLTGALQIPEQAVAAGLGQIRRGARALRGQEDDFDRVLGTEVGARIIGYLQGAREGSRAFAHTLRTGDVPDFVTKVESRSQRAIGGLKGEIIRTPSRMLAAEDEFFKAIAGRMELNGLAVRQARREGLRGTERAARIDDLTRNPTDEMLERSLQYARYLTFQKPLGRIGQRISATTQDHPWLKLFIPFVRTPTNILKFAVERSPLGLAMKEVRAEFAAGGERRALAASRMMLGTGFGLMVTQWASDGTITGGGPADRGARDLMMADGWQPYSVRIGDTYHSYARLDPLSTTLGVAADLVDFGRHMTDRQSERSGALLLAAIMRNLGNKTWLSGVSDLLGAFDDPDRNLENVLGRLAGSIVVPTGIAQITRTMDPVLRESREPSQAIRSDNELLSMFTPYLNSMAGRIQSRVPGLSDDLPARRDVWGAEMRGEGGVGPDAVSPIWTRGARNDPITAELLTIGASIGRPGRTITVDGERRRLTAPEYSRYAELAGRYTRDDLVSQMASPGWEELDNEGRREAVKRIKRDARADARADLAQGETLPPLPPGFQMRL